MNTLYISGEIAPDDQFLQNEGAKYTSAKKVKEFLDVFEGDELTAEIDTPGGSVTEGYVIYDILDLFKKSGKKLKTVGYQANSIGSVLLLAGDERLVSDNFQGLIHNAWLDPKFLLGTQLNAEVLEKLTEEAQKSDAQILNTYTDILGKDKEQLLIALMSEQTILNADMALELGFATGKVQAKDVQASRVPSYSMAMMNLINDHKMNNEIVTKMEALFAKIEGIWKSKAKNMQIDLADGKAIYVESEDGELPGKKAFMIVEGQPTNEKAPDGPHKLRDGREIVVADGVISSVKEAAPVETVDSLKALMENQKKEYEAKIADMEKDKTVQAQIANEMTTQVKALKDEFSNFKNQIAGDLNEDKEDFTKRFENKKPEELSVSDKIQLRILSK